MRPNPDEHITIHPISPGPPEQYPTRGYLAELLSDHTGHRVHPRSYATGRTPETALATLLIYVLPELAGAK